MTQIKENQIIPTLVIEQNPISAPPRDLVLPTTENPNALEIRPIKTVGNSAAISGSDNAVSEGDQSSGTTIADQAINSSTLPAIPAIIGIKSQTVNFKDDGSTTIDLILLVKDVPGVAEIDVRIAKVAGNL